MGLGSTNLPTMSWPTYPLEDLKMYRKFIAAILLCLGLTVHADEAGVGKEGTNTSSTQAAMASPSDDSSWYVLLLEWFGAN